MLHREHTPECMFVCRCARVVRRCLYSRCSRPRVLLSDRIGVDQCSLTEQLTWGKTPLSARRPFLFLPFSSFVLSRLLSLTLLSLTQTEIPPSYCTQLSLSLSFSVFRSLTLSVSFYIMLSVKIPCGRAVCNKHNRTLWLYTLTCIRVSTHTQTLAWTHAVYASLVTLLCTTLFT